MTIFPANLRVIARIHAGKNVARKDISIDPPDGDPINHLGVPLFAFRKLFSEMEKGINFDIPGVPSGYIPSAYDCFAPAQREVRNTLPRHFDLEGNNVFPQAHAWIDGHWVRLMGNQYGFGFLITKLNGNLYEPLIESVKWGGTPVSLVLDFVLSIYGTAP